MVDYKKIARVFMGMSFLLSGLGSCDKAEFSYSNEPAHLIYDSREHIHSPVFTSALGNVGLFMNVSIRTQSNRDVFVFSDSRGEENVIPFNAADARRKFVVGMNNGVIVGYGNLDIPAPLYVYDKECPHCFKSYAIPQKSYPLNIKNTGISVCNNCQREYNLNTGGNQIKGEGSYKLTRYRASNNPKEVLIVNN